MVLGMEVEAIGEVVEVGLPTVFKNIENFSGAYISISSKACYTVDNLVSALSYMYISLMFILIRNKSR